MLPINPFSTPRAQRRAQSGYTVIPLRGSSADSRSSLVKSCRILFQIISFPGCRHDQAPNLRSWNPQREFDVTLLADLSGCSKNQVEQLQLEECTAIVSRQAELKICNTTFGIAKSISRLRKRIPIGSQLASDLLKGPHVPAPASPASTKVITKELLRSQKDPRDDTMHD